MYIYIYSEYYQTRGYMIEIMAKMFKTVEVKLETANQWQFGGDSAHSLLLTPFILHNIYCLFFPAISTILALSFVLKS